MSTQLIEVLEPQNVNNDDLPQKEFKSDLKGIIRGEFDNEMPKARCAPEPSHLSFDIWSYCDNPKDSEL